MLHTRQVLICDDEAPIRQIVAAKLRSSGYVVHEARNGLEGFSFIDPSVLPVGVQARTNRGLIPDLVLTDLQMPVLSGLELAQRLRATRATRDVPVIMLTARGYILTPEQLAQTNIKHLLPKPFGVRQLMELVISTVGPAAREGAIAA